MLSLFPCAGNMLTESYLLAASEAVLEAFEFMLSPPMVETSFAFLCQIGGVSDENAVASLPARIIESWN